MSKTIQSYTLGLYTDDSAMDDYIKHEIQEYTVLSLKDMDEFNGCNIILLFDAMAERNEVLLDIANRALESKIDVIWYVESDNEEQQRLVEEELRFKGAYVHNELIEDAAKVISLLSEICEEKVHRLEEESKQQAPGVNKRTVRLPSSTRDVSKEIDLADDGDVLDLKSMIGKASSAFLIRNRNREKEIILPNILENVIAVAGYKGAGSSFISWNLARVTEKPTTLVEGRQTGTLAAWFGGGQELTQRSDFLESHMATENTPLLKLALRADKEIEDHDLEKLQSAPGQLVVDCGDRWDLEVFKRAAVRIFVVSPDPQFVNETKPDVDVHSYILNQYPEGASIPIQEFEKRFNMKFDLVVPSSPRQVLNSLWSNRAWIVMLDPELKAAWKELLSPVERELILT